MFSASLNKATFLQLKRDYKGTGKIIYESANQVNAWFIALKKTKAEQNEFVLELLDSGLQLLLLQFMEAAEQVLQTDTSQNLLEAYFEVKNFFKIVELLDDSYVIYGEKDKNDLKIKLFCMNPAKAL